MQVPAFFADPAGPAVSDAPPWALASMPHQLHSDPVELEGARSAFKSFFEQLFPGLKVPGDDFGQGDEQIDLLMHHAGGPFVDPLKPDILFRFQPAGQNGHPVRPDDEGQRGDGEAGPVVIAEAWSARRGKLLHTQKWSVASLDSQIVTEVGRLEYAPPLEMVGDTVVLLLEARTTVACDSPSLGCTLASHSYTFGVVAPSSSRASSIGDDVVAPLAALRAANTTCVVVTGTTNVTVSNTGANIALNVKLTGHNKANVDDTQSSAVEWVAFDANYFSLRPGETRYVQLLELGRYQNVTSVSVSSWNQQC